MAQAAFKKRSEATEPAKPSFHGSFCWNELMTRDIDGAQRFYRDTVGWSFEPMKMDWGTYWIAKSGDKNVGGMFELSSPEFDGVPNSWMSYLAVDDVDARVTKAKKAGAKLMRPIFDVPDIGRIAILKPPKSKGLTHQLRERNMEPHKIVSHDEWTKARKALLAKEKEFTQARDRLSAERRALPWVKVDKTYVFDTPSGLKTLADLFDGRSQLLVYHFMRELLLPRRSFRWRQHPPRSARRDLRRRFPCAARRDKGVQASYGLEISLGLVFRGRFQLRFPCVLQRGRDRQGG
jgi:predicted enzyme related to lactoylglutathione lyase